MSGHRGFPKSTVITGGENTGVTGKRAFACDTIACLQSLDRSRLRHVARDRGEASCKAGMREVRENATGALPTRLAGHSTFTEDAV